MLQTTKEFILIYFENVTYFIAEIIKSIHLDIKDFLKMLS